MGDLLKILFRTTILDDTAYQAWHERPNLFLRGILLIVVITLVAGLVSFGVNLVNMVKPVNLAAIEDQINQQLGWQSQFNPGFQDPEVRAMIDEMIDSILPMISDITSIKPPLGQGISGLFQALGSWVVRALTAIGGWLFYGALVLIAVRLLGGTGKLTELLGMVSLYVIPGLLGLLSPIPCLGSILLLVGTIWSIVVYVKAVSVTSGLDAGRSILAVFAPIVAIILLGLVISSLLTLWLVIVF
jgi:hypothetical protein